MDIGTALLKEHSKSQCKKIVSYIGGDKRKFAKLMNIFFTGDSRISQRAAWPMSYCVEVHPELIIPYFRQMMTMLTKAGVHDAVIRNILRILHKTEIPKRFHGKIMTICFEYLTAENGPVAIKSFSLTVLDKLSIDYPEIRRELKFIIAERIDKETSAFKSRAKKILIRP